jgi:tRNA nucleotidyltransferase (CCA-adding enzyme)
MKLIIPQEIKDLIIELNNNGFSAHIIGGAPRDYVISQIHNVALPINDYDIFTNASGEDISRIFPQGVIIGNEKRREKILTVVVNNTEISTYRKSGDRLETGKTLEEHLATCDFTFNSMYCGLDGEIHDTQNGINSIINKEVKFCGDPKIRINEDKLRILRGLRFSTKYGFTFIENPFNAILNGLMLEALSVSKDRIHEEILKTLSGGFNLETLLECNLFNEMFNELNKCYDVVNHGKWHKESLEDHIKMCFLNTCNLSRNPLLRLASLLHDIGKAQAYDSENHTFYQHHKIGADIAREELTKWRFDSKEINYVCCLIYNHMNELSTIKQINNFIRELSLHNVSFEDFCVLAYSDRNANKYWEPMGFNEWLQKFKPYVLYKESLKFPTLLSVKDLKVSGEDLKELGLSPGPLFGKILKELLEKVDSCELINERYTLIPAINEIIAKKEKD